MITRSRIWFRSGSTALIALALLHLGAGLLHPCCLGGASMEHPSEHHADMPTMHDGAQPSQDGHGPSHSGDDHQCDGVCGFCCETMGDAALPSAPLGSLERPDAPVSADVPRLVSATPASDSFLLPFAIGPPV